MKFNISVIELWFWRIGIILLFICCLALMKGDKQAQYMGLNNIKLIKEQGEQITKILQNELTNQIVLKAVTDDYPPKKKLGDREWCLNRSCLIGTDEF